MCEICVLLFTVQLNPIFLPDICSVHLLIRAALLYHLIIWEAELQSDIFQQAFAFDQHLLGVVMRLV